MKVNLHFWGLGICIFLSGCAGLSPSRYLSNKQTFMVNQGNPPSYVDGYVDGCSSGRRLGGDKRFVYRKNSSRFDKEALYATGWQQGQINCRNEILSEAQIEPKSNKKTKTPTNSIELERQKRVEAESKAAEAELHEMWEELKK